MKKMIVLSVGIMVLLAGGCGGRGPAPMNVASLGELAAQSILQDISNPEFDSVRENRLRLLNSMNEIDRKTRKTINEKDYTVVSYCCACPMGCCVCPPEESTETFVSTDEVTEVELVNTKSGESISSRPKKKETINFFTIDSGNLPEGAYTLYIRGSFGEVRVPMVFRYKKWTIIIPGAEE